MKNIGPLTAAALFAAAISLTACDSAQQKQTPAAQGTATEQAAIELKAAPAPRDDSGAYVCQRPAQSERLFTSQAIEQEIVRVQQMLTNARLARARRYGHTYSSPTTTPRCRRCSPAS